MAKFTQNGDDVALNEWEVTLIQMVPSTCFPPVTIEILNLFNQKSIFSLNSWRKGEKSAFTFYFSLFAFIFSFIGWLNSYDRRQRGLGKLHQAYGKLRIGP